MNSKLFAGIAESLLIHYTSKQFIPSIFRFLKFFTYKWLTEFTISDDHSHLLDVANDERKKNVSREL